MANPNFVPNYTTDEVYVGTDTSKCLTDELNDMEQGLNGKAPANHAHAEYAPEDHEHDSYAPANHEHQGYAQNSHTHSEYAPANHTHTQYAPVEHAHTGYADADHTHSGYAATNHEHDGYAPANHSHDYAPANHAHTEYSLVSHNHDNDYVAKAIQVTGNNGACKYSYRVADNKNVLDEIKAAPVSMFTVYSQAGVTGNPNTTEAWRMLVHKTNDTNILWVKAFGGAGSEYTNYCSDGVWKGWKCIYDANPTALWTGAYLMTAEETVTPSKKLSECKHGWILEWSDYDVGETEGTANSHNIVHTIIYKKTLDANWSGKNMMVSVPSYIASTGGTITHALKQLIVYDDRIVGHQLNDQGSANPDAALRSVYEF